MNTEISNFIKVWSSIFISLCYCYEISKVVPKGKIRLIMFLPVICSFFILTLSLNSFHLASFTAYFVTWLTTFKLLLFSFGRGPLSNPSLSLFKFAFISCFPILIPKNPTSQESSSTDTKNTRDVEKSTNSSMLNVTQRSLWNYAIKLMVLLLLIIVGLFKDKLDRPLMLFLSCIFIYLGLDVTLGLFASIGQLTLGIEIEPAFDEPYFSTSLQDFWSQRWNRVSSDALRRVVYIPIRNHLREGVLKQWANDVALVGTFIVSSLMHEIVFYHLTRVRPGYGTTLFFFIHGLGMIVEGKLKKKIGSRWQLPRFITGPLILGLNIWTLSWLVLSPLLNYKLDDRALEEYVTVGAYFMGLSRTLCNWALTTIEELSIYRLSYHN